MAESSGRSLLLLGLSLILLAVVVGVVIFDRLVQPTGPLPAASLPAIQLTAREALAPAAEMAGQWQEDARMAAVSAFWSRVGILWGGQAEWAFQFFSPSTRRLAIITVVNGRARMVRESASPYMVTTFSAEEWNVDSDQALQTWWNRGGGALVSRRPEIDLAMQLRPLDESGQLAWSVAGSTAGTEAAFTVVVSAVDGTVLE
jgi:hypothetical protein